MPRNARPIVDFHAHMLEVEVHKCARNKTVLTGYGAVPGAGTQSNNPGTYLRMTDPKEQLADMDRLGVDVNVISASTVIQGTAWADPQIAFDLDRRSNDRVAEWCAEYPGRYVGSFTLPMQDVDRSLKELERAATQLKISVANMCAHYDGTYLGEPRYAPFWEAVNDLGIVVWIHPDGIRDLWFQQYGMWNSIGQSIEEAKVMTSLIYGGIVERYPDIPIVMAHGGGYFPHNMGRLDRNVTNRPDSMKHITKKPSEYLRAFYYDTCLYDTSILAALIKVVGADRVVMGSDYPVGEADPIGFVERCPGITAAEVDMITGRTAATLLGLKA
ncbi:MAG: amidohydrolase family protein [Rhizobiales bacterium]|nr:amidohydrolase family protein [Hyphomicrobiales bacterium]